MNIAKRMTVILLVSFFPSVFWAQVSYERLLHAPQEARNWLTFAGDYAGHKYSQLDQININNVEHLAVQWIFQTGVLGQFETTPLVIDGIMYVTGQDNFAYALDARTGRTIWRYQHRLAEKILACCGRVNRGFAALGNKVFLATLDAHVVALDAKSGSVVWDVAADDYSKGYSFTVAPLAVKNKIIVGVSGGEYGIRGFIDAYDAETGKRAWRFYTIPGPGESGHETWKGDSWEHGGAPAWVTGTYDPGSNLIYWGIGNPGPDFYGESREGDNLYSNCVVALDADTGKLRWHFQFTPHDVHDWDATQVPVLVDMEYKGEPHKLLMQANRNGFFYGLDRISGKFLFARPFARVTWAEGIGPEGRPLVVPGKEPTPEGTSVCPGAFGATNFMSPSYSPQTGLLYLSVREQCDKITNMSPPYEEGRYYVGSGYQPARGEKDWGALRALDPRNGEMRWEFKYFTPPMGGVLSTAGRLVFAGNLEGYFMAFDAATGKELWHLQTGSAIFASPMTYAVEGRQYVVIASGSAVLALGLPEKVH